MSDTSTYVFYGVLVAEHDPEDGAAHSYDVWASLLEGLGYDTDLVAEGVRYLMCGAYDRNDLYLKIDQDGFASCELEPGQRRVFRPHPLPNGEWNGALVTAADSLGLKILDGPAWFAVSDEG